MINKYLKFSNLTIQPIIQQHFFHLLNFLASIHVHRRWAFHEQGFGSLLLHIILSLNSFLAVRTMVWFVFTFTKFVRTKYYNLIYWDSSRYEHFQVCSYINYCQFNPGYKKDFVRINMIMIAIYVLNVWSAFFDILTFSLCSFPDFEREKNWFQCLTDRKLWETNPM